MRQGTALEMTPSMEYAYMPKVIQYQVESQSHRLVQQIQVRSPGGDTPRSLLTTEHNESTTSGMRPQPFNHYFGR